MTTVFAPAESKAEAAARIYSLAGATPEPLGPGSTEKKSVLLQLARALKVEVDERATKPDVGRQLAGALDVEWDTSCWSTGSTITMVGLNRLLLGASAELAGRARAEEIARPDVLHGWAEFVPARTKLEVVNRISALTDSGPQRLGPGSKERKSVLQNAVVGLQLDMPLTLSKTRLAAALAIALDSPWDASCWSTGETLTLDGLNSVLAGMERSLGLLGTARTFLSVEQEAAVLLDVLDASLPEHWDGRQCVEEMRAAEYAHWRQMEWPGFYFEFRGIPALVDAFGGGPRAVGSVRFDYALDTTWDLKCHSNDARGEAPLNDRAAMQAAIAEGPLGLLVLSGDRAHDESGQFDQWHRDVTRTERQKRPSNSGVSRGRKSAFTPTSLTAFVIRGTSHHDSLVASGTLTTMNQGRQAGGAPRAPKYALRMRNAHLEADLVAAEIVRVT